MKLPQIQSQFVAISGGMDLTTPPIAKANGEAIMALNVQPNYGGGFSRIEGYECLDGATVPSKMQHYHLRLNRNLPESAVVVGQSFQLHDRLCYVLAVRDNHLVFAALEPLMNVDVGTAFTLDGQGYVTTSPPFSDSGDAMAYQQFQADAFQLGVDLVQAVPGENPLRGVVALNEQIIAFRDQAVGCGVFIATKNHMGWQAAPTSYLVELKEISKPQDLIDGMRFSSGAKQGEVLSEILAVDNLSGYLVINIALSANAEIRVNGELVAKVKSCKAVTLSKGKPWQFIYHNFYGSPKTQYAYGCNGEEVIEVRPNGVIVPIRAQAEKPKYICAHRNHLFIAFEGGQFGHSLVGQPTKWSVLLGSDVFGVTECL